MKINELTLYTSNLISQFLFYSKVLDFKVLSSESGAISFVVGKSVLKFVNREHSKPYHVAIAVSPNKIEKVCSWLKERTLIIPYKNKQIIDFEDWKAKSIYFYDKDRNILEFISRDNTNLKTEENFSNNDFMAICEVGIPTDNIASLYDQIHQLKPIEIYDGSFDRFCAAGNEEGMFIIVDKTKKKWFPTNDEMFSADFIIKGDYNFKFENGKINKI